MADHDHADAIVGALKQFDVRRQVLCQQVIMSKRHQWHFDVRVDRAGADAGKMFQTTETAGGLQAAHVHRRIAQDFARRSAERSRVQTVRELAAFLGNDRHHGSEVDVKAEHSQDFASDATQRSRSGKVAVLANRARRRHRRENLPQTIYQATFLIDAAQGSNRQHRARAIKQFADLFGRFDVASEKDYAAGLDLFDQRPCLFIQFGARKTDEKRTVLSAVRAAVSRIYRMALIMMAASQMKLNGASLRHQTTPIQLKAVQGGGTVCVQSSTFRLLVTGASYSLNSKVTG